MNSAFHQLGQRYIGTLTSTAPTAVRLWETFTFLYYLVPGNSLVPSNGMSFSTRDHDNDASSYSICTERYNAAWWYNDCTETNLNGKWFTKAKVDEGYQMDLSQGVTWDSWRGPFYSLKRVEMKVRRA